MTHEEILAGGPDAIYWCGDPRMEGNGLPAAPSRVKIGDKSWGHIKSDPTHQWVAVYGFSDISGFIDYDPNCGRPVQIAHLYETKEEAADRYLLTIRRYLHGVVDELRSDLRWAVATQGVAPAKAAGTEEFLDLVMRRLVSVGIHDPEQEAKLCFKKQEKSDAET